MARRTFPMEAGERTKQIRLIPIVQSQGRTGFPVETDGAAVTLWASKEDLRGQERLAADQMSAPFTTRWEVPYLEAIDPDRVDVPKAYELEYLGRRHQIQAASLIDKSRQGEGVELLTLAR